jgi:hypothetical protein
MGDNCLQFLVELFLRPIRRCGLGLKQHCARLCNLPRCLHTLSLLMTFWSLLANFSGQALLQGFGLRAQPHMHLSATRDRETPVGCKWPVTNRMVFRLPCGSSQRPSPIAEALQLSVEFEASSFQKHAISQLVCMPAHLDVLVIWDACHSNDFLTQIDNAIS